MHSNLFWQISPGDSEYARFLLVLGIMVLIFFIVYILYLKNLQDLLKSVRTPNRKIAPGMVWLVLLNFLAFIFIIPGLTGNVFPQWLNTAIQYACSMFGLVFTFYMVNKITESIVAELSSRNIPMEGRPTYALGMFMCGCNTLSLVSSLPYLQSIGLMASGAGFVAWIMYWYKTSAYKNILRSLPPDKEF